MEQLKIHDIYKIIDINDKFFTDNTPSLPYQESFLDLKKRSSIASMDQIVTSSSDKNIIGTTALDTCFGIVFYDRINKWGMVGHGSPSGKIQLLGEMLHKLGNKPRIIEYQIVPGYRNIEKRGYDTGMDLHEYLHDFCPKNIILTPLKTDLGVKVCSNVLAYEFAFDVNTGKTVSHKLFPYEKTDFYGKFLK